MRTGSNFLEANINAFPDLHSHGELFNPYFIGGAKKEELFGITMQQREKDPFQVLDAIRSSEPGVIAGFRFFHDHDPRILEHCLNDPECGKIILTRNPLDSYISRKIAALTGQWKLTNLKHSKTAKIDFDAAEFEAYLDGAQAFQLGLLRALQTSGQSAFYINYDDIHSLDVLNGLARYLGSDHQISALDTTVKKQNPSVIESKVNNFVEMTDSIKKIDFMGIFRTPNFEPRRGAGVPRFLAAKIAPLLFLPIKGGPSETVEKWLIQHEVKAGGQIIDRMNQKTLRDWRQAHPGFHSMTVLRHPVERVYYSFCHFILSYEQGAYREIREAIIRNFRVKVPKKGADAGGYDLDAHKKAFVAFLKFVKANLSRQTSLRIDPAWASQSAIIQGAATVVIPQHVINERNLASGLAHLEMLLGLSPVSISVGQPAYPFALSDVYDAGIESRVREIYMQDYLNFGFDDWAPTVEL